MVTASCISETGLASLGAGLAGRCWPLLAGMLLVWGQNIRAGAGAEEDYYAIDTYQLPPGLRLEVSGLVSLPDGRMAMALRKGEVWILQDSSQLENPRFRLFASGLHEPLGLAFHAGDFYTVQRTELTRLRDRNGDGLADEYLTVAKGWGVTGNYHEYGYGPVMDAEGRAWLTLNCTIGKTVESDNTSWRGWSLRVDPDGSWHPVSGGFRSPCGLGFNGEGDLFATDQQGNWFPACALVLVRPGAFHGHADALKDCGRPGATFSDPGPLPKNITVAEAARRVPAYELPAVWFPYQKMGMSTTDILCDTTQGRFGPFQGQLLVGEFTMSALYRVFLEKVNGEYQGACFPFRKGFQSAVLRLAWTREGELMVGQSNRGWNSLGSRSFGLQKLRWTGRTPFEIKEMRARPDGFEVEFTKPADPDSLRRKGGVIMKSYTYAYHERYGSEEVDGITVGITGLRLREDGRTVQIGCDGLREGYVHELRVDGVRSSEGEPVLHSIACYTLNRIPQ